VPPGPRRRGGVARGSKGAGGRSRRLLRQQRRLPHPADAPGRHSCFIHPYTLTRVTRGSQCQQHAAVCTRQVGVLVRRQWTLDTRNFGYQFTWVLNGFVLALNASTYLLVEQPPLSAQPASVYRDDMGCDPTEPSGRQGCVCHVPMDEAASNGQYNVGADATECGRAILASANAVFAFRGFLFLVINALFVNEAVFVPAVIADKRFFAREHGARAHSFLISPRISPYLPISPHISPRRSARLLRPRVAPRLARQARAHRGPQGALLHALLLLHRPAAPRLVRLLGRRPGHRRDGPRRLSGREYQRLPEITPRPELGPESESADHHAPSPLSRLRLANE